VITIAFKKTIDGIYVSHTDILRCLNRTFRRAGIEVAYSKGYNRHMSLKLTQPLPFGIASDEEWVSCEIVGMITTEELLEKFNLHCPPYLKAHLAYKVEGNPNLAALVVASDYFIECKEAIKYKAEIEKIKNHFEVEINRKEEQYIKEVSQDIYGLAITDKGIYFQLPFGNKNLRIDSVGNQLAKNFGLEIDNTNMRRLHQYVSVDNKFIEVSKYLETLKI